jgi:hypothetical protein
MATPEQRPGPEKTANPFQTSGSPAVGDRLLTAAEMHQCLKRARRTQLVQLLVAVVLFTAIAGTATYLILESWQTAERRLQHSQEWTDQSGRYMVIIASNYAAQARLAQHQSMLAASQAGADREAVVALRTETAMTITNAALNLTRQLSRALNDLGQSNIMALDLHYAARLQNLEKQMEAERQKLLQTTLEQLKRLTKELSKYDPLLKIDPDVAGRIQTALAQLQQLVEITELLKLRQEDQVKNLQNQITLLNEKLKVLELRLDQFQSGLSGLLSNPPPGLRLATNPPPPAPKPAP